MGGLETKIQQLVRQLSIAFLLSWLSACGTNPVTGESELQFISTEQEIKMGEQAYFPTRQAQGGDYTVHESVTLYVQQVNNRLAAVSDRDLPFEIVVLNSSIPNAWAMPGGKMAINRGLLTQLNSEAELAAVLGHEIVHSAARHSAKSQERNMLLQGGVIAAQIASAGSDYSNLIAGGAVLGSQLVTTRYGRDAELESDLYGMEYMVRAGYNPNAAIDLQQTFVRLSEGRQSGWVEGLFASHPPSPERVARNRETAARLGGENLEYGRERYRAAIAPLLKDAAAYKAHDMALKAAKAGDMKAANTSIEEAIRLQPREPKFYGLKGDLALQQKQFRAALVQYNKAISLDSDYFAYYLQKGYAKKELGDLAGATKALEKSNQLLPTPNAQKTLGDLALRQGDKQRALQYYSSASNSRSEVGQEALVSMVRLELEEKPSKYLKTRTGLDNQGRVVIVIYNRSPVTVRSVEVTIAYFNNRSDQISPPERLRLQGKLSPGGNGTVTTRLTEGKGLRSVVSKARIAK